MIRGGRQNQKFEHDFRPIWFGRPSQPLAGFLHEPQGPVKGAVVLCAPFGYEYTCTHRSIRALANELSREGLVALRFDYAGSGASSGRADSPDSLQLWQDSVVDAIAELRSRGFARPGLFGLRLGAALALQAAAADPSVGALAVWAPVTSGKRYVRELRAQSAVTPGERLGGGAMNVMGNVASAGLLTQLRSWDPLAGVPQDLPILVVNSPGGRGAAESTADLQTYGLRLQLAELPGTELILERTAEEARVPRNIVDHIAAWFSSTLSDVPATTDAEHVDVRTFDDGEGRVRERILRIGRHGNYAVETSSGEQSTDDDVYVFWNNGVGTSSGPGRAWVEFSRALAARGKTTVRFDLSGLGNGPAGAAEDVNAQFGAPRSATKELRDVVAHVRANGARTVTAIGLCSGAQLAVRAAGEDIGIDRVYSINPQLFFPRDIGSGPAVIRQWWHVISWPMSKAKVRALAYRLPTLVWALLDVLRIYPRPSRLLAGASRRGVDVKLVLASDDPAVADVQAREPRLLRSDRPLPGLTVRLIEGMDHSMFSVGHREIVLAGILEDCCTPAVSAEPATVRS